MKPLAFSLLTAALITAGFSAHARDPQPDGAPLKVSGTYPHLAVFSPEGECGIGAVVPWADRLWFITYPPHHPSGGGDKLWTIDKDLTLTARPESVGGTHANRFIHRESQQLIIGPYFIDGEGNVRVIPPSTMPGRLTGTARHLLDPANKVYMFSMEEGNYEVDVHTLAVRTNFPDMQRGSDHIPGTHGKGGYSGQGRLIYANNGEQGWSINRDRGLNGPAGALVENRGQDWSNGWSIVERKNFCEVTGPGGLYGNSTDANPIWCTGWDKRSVILKLLDHGRWHTYRLPKGSYTHDALHGWYTEWPRIREVMPGKLLMHMHGLFYEFPKTFSEANTRGIAPLCSYLKMPVDYCWWNGQIVMGRDDTSITGGNQWAGQSHSAPWFGQLSDMKQWGTPAGFGGPWKDDDVTGGQASDPFLVSSFKYRTLHLRHETGQAVTFTIEDDRTGKGDWRALKNISVPPHGTRFWVLPPALKSRWIRIIPEQNARGVTAYFQLGNSPQKPAKALFRGIADARVDGGYVDGIIRPRTGDARVLEFASIVYGKAGEQTRSFYEVDGALSFTSKTGMPGEDGLRSKFPLSKPDFTVDPASVLVTEGTNRFRLPKTDPAYDRPFASGWPRCKREVVTERDLFQAHGTFYELPKSGSGGFRRIRPIATHGKHISDFGSWRGLLVIAGTAAPAKPDGHLFAESNGPAGLWFGDVDDLWRMGPPRGIGGPWNNEVVTADTPSDPYLMFGYEQKMLEISHNSPTPVVFVVEVDFAADNSWNEYARFTVRPGRTLKHMFPAGYSAHWVRLRTLAGTIATATFTYGPQ